MPHNVEESPVSGEGGVEIGCKNMSKKGITMPSQGNDSCKIYCSTGSIKKEKNTISINTNESI